MAICGDSSDNIPGIPGFGPKKAGELIGKFGSLEQIYDHLDELSGKTRETLESSRDVAFLSKRLAQIDTNVPLEADDAGKFVYKTRDIFSSDFINFLKKYEFKSLLPRHLATDTKTLSSLSLDIREVTTHDALKRLEVAIESETEIGIATTGKDFSELSGISLSLGETVYWIDPVALDVRDFLKHLLESNKILIGFDVKPDLKRIWYYQENHDLMVKNGKKDVFPGQISMF